MKLVTTTCRMIKFKWKDLILPLETTVFIHIDVTRMSAWLFVLQTLELIKQLNMVFLYLRQISNIQSQEAKKSTVALMRELANKLAKQLVEEQKLYLKRPRKFLSECRFCKKRTRYTSSKKYEKKRYSIYTGILLNETELSY